MSAKDINDANLDTVFSDLRKLLAPYAKRLELKKDTESQYYLDSKVLDPKGKPLFFGAAMVKTKFVSFHLMPVYVNPELLEDMSPELRKRMQGKSCFNFKTRDAALFRELKALTKSCFDQWKKDKRV
ncbi:MAG: hypothetical protein ACI9KE_000984 [Polyangiales bacterium]|jgi:hypothetical protein